MVVVRPGVGAASLAVLIVFGCASPGETGGRPPVPPDNGGRLAFPVATARSQIHVDGVLDDAAWETATRVPLPFETSPADNGPARVQTECLVAADRTTLYFGCRASDPRPSDIRAVVSDRDRSDGQDRIALVLDPFNDARRAFYFWVNAIGVQADAVLAQDASEPNVSWDAIWRSAGRPTAAGYGVEAAIPFRSLRFPSAAGPQTWGFFFVREYPRRERVELRSMRVDRGDRCVLCQANLLTDLDRLSPGRNIDVSPTVTGLRTDTRELPAAGPFARGTVTASPGLDVRWGLGSNLSVNATVNPDFSQVEADTPQLDANSAFALQVQEKRPFFLEGADLFATPIAAVFTRSIVDPRFGTKLSGKIGRHALGVMVTQDAVTSLLIPGTDESASLTLERPVTTLVGRYRRDVGASSSVGVLYTDRVGDGYGNRVAGADAFIQISKPASLRLQLLRSSTVYPTATAAEHGQAAGRFAGSVFRAAFTYDSRRWVAGVTARAEDPGFRADAGFLPQVGLRGAVSWLFRQAWGQPGQWFSRIQIGPFLTTLFDAANRPKYRYTGLVVDYRGPLQTQVMLNPYVGRETYQGRSFDVASLYVVASARPSRMVSADVTGVIGRDVDYTNVRPADMLRVEPSVTLRFGRHLDLRLMHARQQLSLDGRPVLSSHATEVRAVYNFTPRMMVRAVLQQRTTTRNPAMQVEPQQPESTTLLGQLLFSYKLNPQTVVFVGYSDDRRGFTDIDSVRVPLTAKSRTFFLKLGYAWRP